MRRKRDKYIYNPNIKKYKIMSFWEGKLKKSKLATEKFMQCPDCLVKDISKEFNVYQDVFYYHLNKLKELGLVYAV